MKYFSFKAGVLAWVCFSLPVSASYAQPAKSLSKNRPEVSERKVLSDSALLDLVQKQTFKYFWDYAHPVSGLARERSNKSFDYGDEVVTTGGSGFGVMAIIVATKRKWITRDTAVR
ncbi:MAG TPA: hypothetical protein VFC34_12505, partial [Puia sp.]|nr:hypothetical protein [Puia sp.]